MMTLISNNFSQKDSQSIGMINSANNINSNNSQNQNRMLNQIQMQLKNLQDGHQKLTNQINQLILQDQSFVKEIENLKNIIIQLSLNKNNEMKENLNVTFKLYEEINGQLLINIPFNENEKVFSVIQKYWNRVNDFGNKQFIFNGKYLDPNLSCRDVQLINSNLLVHVIDLKGIDGA